VDELGLFIFVEFVNNQRQKSILKIFFYFFI